MTCPACQAQNLDDAEFCTQCGVRLVVACPSCRTSNRSGDRFCRHCGQKLETAGPPVAPKTYTPPHLAEKILTSRATLEGERKQVTVLFADVSGFTTLSEKLDPEDVHQLMDRAFELMLAEVHRYEGTVNQFLGDGLMALFGAPIAHEDHPVRAVHTALGIQRALAGYRDALKAEPGIDFQVRMGLNTGAVVVGKIGDNLRMDYTAVGDTTNLAARLVAIAEPGQVLVGESTSRAVEPYFFLRPLGEVAVKGKTLPVRAYRVEATRDVRSRIEAVVERGLTPLVGRERELALLRDRFDEVKAGRGQAVFVFGEAGIGKSRLLYEFRRVAEAEDARWVMGRAVSYGREIPYLPVLDLVRDLLGIKETESVETTLERIDAGVRRLGEDLVWVVPFVRALFSLDPGERAVVEMSPPLRRGRIKEALQSLILRESQHRPAVLVVEGLHWIDPLSEEVLRMLLESIAAAAVYVLLTHRPGYSLPFRDQTYFTRITLHSLPNAQAGAMVEQVFGGGDLPAAVRDLIVRKAEGNPLFVEELSRALLEDGTLEPTDGGYRLVRGLGEVVVPDTIQGVIMARIDRLPEAAKTALQVACVIGREFPARLVEQASGMDLSLALQALRDLRAVELIYEKAGSIEPTYLFKHALTHEVAYESLLRQRRRALHRKVGELVEEIYADRLPEFYASLAQHFVRGEAWAKAVEYLLKAADGARAHFEWAGAIARSSDAVEILERHGGEDSRRIEALIKLGDLKSLLGDPEGANIAYDRALALASEPTRARWIENKRHRLGFAVRHEVRLAYFEHGDGTPTLVLYTPLLFGLQTFQPIVERLCQEMRVVTVDLRGQGASSPLPDRPYYREEEVEDLVAVIEQIRKGPVVLMGNSRGGTLSLLLAATHPGLLDKVISVGSPAGGRRANARRTGDAAYIAFVDRVVDLARTDLAAAVRMHFSRVWTEPGTHDLRELLIRRVVEMVPPATIRNFFIADIDFDLTPFLPAIQAPTLILHGEADQLVPVEAAHYMGDRIPGAQVYLFKGRDHGLAATATAELVQVLRNFIRTGRPI